MKRFLCWLIGHKWQPYVDPYRDAGVQCHRCLRMESLIRRPRSASGANNAT